MFNFKKKGSSTILKVEKRDLHLIGTLKKAGE